MKNLTVNIKLWFLVLVCVGGLFSFLAKIQNSNDADECSIETEYENSEISQNQKINLYASVER